MVSDQNTSPTGAQTIPEATVASLTGATIGYSGAVPLFENLNLSVKAGEVVVIVGPNGSGKTTLMKSLLGLHPLVKGDRKLLGLSNPDLTLLCGQVGYVPQRLSLNPNVPITGHELLRLKREKNVSSRQSKVLKALGLSDDFLNRSLHQLSGGGLQKVLVAYALGAPVKLVGLDEVTEGVDLGAQEMLFGLLRELAQTEKTTFVLVSHDISAVSSYATRVICLHGSIRYDGSPTDRGFHSCLHSIYGEKSLIHDHRH